ncbi:MAG: stage II sporulation protein P [Clostridia bacterium]|nr:stage II sporulation protein P [Clostridia bacterium]
MNKRAYIRRVGRRIAAVAAVITILAAAVPLTRGHLGYRLALAAASLRQPAAAVSRLGQSLFPAAQTVVPPAALAPTEDPLGDTTYADIPTAAPVGDTPAITMISPPGNKGDGGKIVTKKMDTGNRTAGIATLNRSGTAVDVAAALKRQLTLKWADTDAPQVLILHTHTTEPYMTYDGGYYNAADRTRTKDHTKTVCAVGEAIKMSLAAEGVTAIHDTTIHDSPVYSGAYTRSAATAQAYLKKYPTIRVVLDIHRDAVMENGAMVKPTATVAGKKAAQMMLITGVVDTTALPHARWRENLTFSTRLQQALDGVSPDLMRPLQTVASRYNQHLSPGWVLVEVGSEGNTVEEAVYSGQILGHTLAKLLN